MSLIYKETVVAILDYGLNGKSQIVEKRNRYNNQLVYSWIERVHDHPPQSPNCRCSLVAADLLAQDLERRQRQEIASQKMAENLRCGY